MADDFVCLTDQFLRVIMTRAEVDLGEVADCANIILGLKLALTGNVQTLKLLDPGVVILLRIVAFFTVSLWVQLGGFAKKVNRRLRIIRFLRLLVVIVRLLVREQGGW